MAESTQKFIPIKEVRDGVVVLKNGEMRLILMVSTTNFDLKSEDEQTAILLQYQNFLNSIDFSIQIYVQSRKFDIGPYVMLLERRAQEQQNELLKIQTREYINFIQTLTEANNIMSKMFFVVIPYAPAVFGKKGRGISSLFGRSKKKQSAKTAADNFDASRAQMEQRRDVIVGGLSRLGLKTQQLGTEELVELFYKVFNPAAIGDAPPIPNTATQTQE